MKKKMCIYVYIISKHQTPRGTRIVCPNLDPGVWNLQILFCRAWSRGFARREPEGRS